MSKRIYGRLAVTNIRNNRKTYVPYILTAALTVMMYFIMDALTRNESVGDGRITSVLEIATGVVVIFSVVFLFYTNSFLIKRRKREIGVYNILGMGKGHIAKMLTLESLIVAGASTGTGLLAGAVFSKLVWLLLVRLLHYDVGMEYMIPKETLLKTVVLFAIIFTMTLVYNLMQVRLSNPTELLRGGNQGEKEPKTKLLLALAGFLLIGYGYYTAVTVESPLAAVNQFFIAVIVVILGTYALFTAGSIVFLKLMRNNKKYYYQSRHFIAVSGMLYRMKQNAAGLASICILSTIVLVLVSTSVCMYLGEEEVADVRYPQEVMVDIYKMTEEKEEALENVIQKVSEKYGVETADETVTHYGSGAAVMEGNKLHLESDGAYGMEGVCELYMLPLENYNRISGENVSLGEDEILFYTTDKKMYGWKSLTIEDQTYRIKKELKDLWTEKKSETRVVEGVYLVFDQISQVEKWLGYIRDTSDIQDGEWLERMCRVKSKITFDFKGSGKACSDAGKELAERIPGEIEDADCKTKELARESFYVLYGGLFFIGIYLGIMFLMATVLIIYYKQISEGYDDRERYQIMQKVGMDKREVKRSIRSQVLMVFFLPLLAAVVHVSVAFTVVKKLLAMLYLVNGTLFLACTAGTIAVFAVFYIIVYGMTAREYYQIVG